MDLETVISHLDNLNKANDQGLEELARIEMAVNQESVDKVFLSIDDMYKHMSKVLPSKSDHYTDRGTFLTAMDQSIKAVKKRTNEGLHKSIASMPDVSPHIKRNAYEIISRNLITLNEALAGNFEPGKMRPEDLSSAHDIIRYMHQIATDAVFDPNGDRWELSYNYKRVRFPSLELHIVGAGTDPNTYYEENPFLQHFTTMDKRGSLNGKRGHEQFNIVGRKGDLSVQMHLGCHYGTLRIKESAPGYDFHFRFTDTTGYS